MEGGWRDGWRGLLKISLDVSSDALVWIFVLLRRDGARESASSDSDGGGHFGPRRAGPPRIVAVAERGRPTESAVRWLSALQHHGADVALICERPQPHHAGAHRAGAPLTSSRMGSHEAETPAGSVPTASTSAGVPQQDVPRISPLVVIRALEVQRQVRIVDAVVPFGRRARLLQRLLPRTLRPEIPGLGPDLEAERAAALIEDAVRQ